MTAPVIVTGAASGIGAALATRLVGQGRAVIGLDRSDAVPPGVAPLPCDLADPASIDSAVELIGRRTPWLSGVANVAGVPGTAPAAAVLAVNWLGARRLTDALLGRIADGGAVVGVASLAGHHDRYADEADRLLELPHDDLLAWAAGQGIDGPAAYDLSKKLLIRYGRRLAAREARRGIRSNTVSPGPVRTPILDDFRTSMGGSVERAEGWTGRHAEPGEIAAPLAFLLSADATWINGVDLVTDGGLLAMRTAGAYVAQPHR